MKTPTIGMPPIMEELNSKVVSARKVISDNLKTYNQQLRTIVPIPLDVHPYTNLDFVRLSYYGLSPWPAMYCYEDWKIALQKTISELDMLYVRKGSERRALDSLQSELRSMLIEEDKCKIFVTFSQRREQVLNEFINSFLLLYRTMEKGCSITNHEIEELWHQRNDEVGENMLDEIIHECINQCDGYSQSVVWIKDGISNLAKEKKCSDWRGLFMKEEFKSFYALVLSETERARDEMVKQFGL